MAGFMEEQEEMMAEEAPVAGEETAESPEEVEQDLYGSRNNDSFWENAKFNKKAYEQMYKSMVGRMVKLLYQDKNVENLNKVLSNGSNPIDTIGKGAAFMAVRTIEENWTMGNDFPPSSVLVVSGLTLVDEMIDYGEHQGFFEMSENERKATRAMAVQEFVNMGEKKGWLNKDALAQEIQNDVVMASREERKQLHKELADIDMAARNSVQKYGADSMGIPPGQGLPENEVPGGQPQGGMV